MWNFWKQKVIQFDNSICVSKANKFPGGEISIVWRWKSNENVNFPRSKRTTRQSFISHVSRRYQCRVPSRISQLITLTPRWIYAPTKVFAKTENWFRFFTKTFVKHSRKKIKAECQTRHTRWGSPNAETYGAVACVRNRKTINTKI